MGAGAEAGALVGGRRMGGRGEGGCSSTRTSKRSGGGCCGRGPAVKGRTGGDAAAADPAPLSARAARPAAAGRFVEKIVKFQRLRAAFVVGPDGATALEADFRQIPDRGTAPALSQFGKDLALSCFVFNVIDILQQVTRFVCTILCDSGLPTS